ncbi:MULTISPECIES: hypothetical protein [unclassified Mammaliicoccus]|uniref:hypothetical protein n=1 Tax=unclassified Mammaliicoccus TaxID=2803851 RepID=UPI001EFAED32|nr:MULTISPECIES: hypothetical protein [unclassified Mammaliicoccus]
MVKFKALVKYKDLEMDKVVEVDDELEMTVKRANEINKKLKEHGKVLERVEESK